MDLAVYWHGRRWGALLDLIDGLPATSRWRTAWLQDDEAVEAALDAGAFDNADREPWSPPLTEWDTKTQILAQILDAISNQTQTSIALVGVKPKRPKPFPRPVTGIDRAKSRRAEAEANVLIGEFGPKAV